MPLKSATIWGIAVMRTRRADTAPIAVPTMLHTPLMSGTNFIHGIVLVGALTVAATADDTLGYIIAIVAVLLGTLNVVGGWVVTDRMLQMFRRRPTADAHKTDPPPTTAAH